VAANAPLVVMALAYVEAMTVFYSNPTKGEFFRASQL